MDVTQVLKQYRKDGIFGELYDKLGSFICYTLEHAYNVGSDDEPKWSPKIALGVYRCVLGTHKLHNGVPFRAFEIMDVPDFMGKPVTGCLFHIGNKDEDSEGCILTGEKEVIAGGIEIIVHSKDAFDKFMAIQKFSDFELTRTANVIEQILS